MSAPIYYKAVSRLTGTIEYATEEHDWMLGWARGNSLHLALWNIVETYPDADPITHRAEDWLRDRMPAYEQPDAPKPPFASWQPQETLRTALRRYNERYNNADYILATHSLAHLCTREQYLDECIRMQDVALRLCGAQNSPCVTPSYITPDMVRFWQNFINPPDEQDDPAIGLPF